VRFTIDTREPIPDDITWPTYGAEATVIDSDGTSHEVRVSHVYDRLPADILWFDSAGERSSYPAPVLVQVHFDYGVNGGRIWIAARYPPAHPGVIAKWKWD
jgi:hypothetical protein